eukprot:681309-Rhodomonas_salina.2
MCCMCCTSRRCRAHSQREQPRLAPSPLKLSGRQLGPWDSQSAEASIGPSMRTSHALLTQPPRFEPHARSRSSRSSHRLELGSGASL